MTEKSPAAEAGTAEASPDQALALVRAFFDEVWAERRYERLPQIFDEECITHQLRSGAPALTMKRGPAELDHHVREWFRALPDARMEAHDYVSDGKKVAVRVTLSGTHLGTWNGLAPTGKPLVFEMMAIYRVERGKIVEDWVVIEAYGAFEQIGLVKPREQLFAGTR